MTTTPTTDLQGLLSAKKAELTQPQLERGDVIDVDPSTGEIVPAASTPVPPSGERQDAGAALAAVGQSPPPAPVEVQTVFPVVPPRVLGGIPYARDYVKLAKTISHTEMVPVAFRGRWDAISATFLRGYEMGLPPMQSLDSFNVIEGKVGLGAEAMRALTINAGHQIILEEIIDDEGEVLAIRADCRRSDWEPGQYRSYTFSMKDAERAGLLRPSRSGKATNWQTYPRAMLEARATSGACRRYFPDVLAGMSYTPEEIRDFNGPAEQEAPPSQPPPAPPAPAPVGSLDNGSTPPRGAASTDIAPATSPEAASTAPTTPPPSPKRGPGRPRKAAASSTPAPSSDAPPAPPPAGSTPLGAEDALPPPTLLAMPEEDSPPTSTAPATSPSDQPGQPAVLSSMRSALTEIIKGLPQIQQPLCRAFIRQHFPSGIEGLDEAQVQKCIDIAVGWPDSAEQHPLPESDDGF